MSTYLSAHVGECLVTYGAVRTTYGAMRTTYVLVRSPNRTRRMERPPVPCATSRYSKLTSHNEAKSMPGTAVPASRPNQPMRKGGWRPAPANFFAGDSLFRFHFNIGTMPCS